MICGDIARARHSGPGSAVDTKTMRVGSTALRAALPRAVCRGGAIPSARGSTPPATCGYSAGTATTQSGDWATSMTCGNTRRAAEADPYSLSVTYQLVAD